ncbi:polymeric immunoglobulin receptor-like [Anabas testudineus]|uniref:polymeric immunoglobulin receptor-like n=1 Tax=Anabas testudineus TaxID=64144 RepID=UPI000E4577F9|nr:polymeric immunoglobulin receptor-like [Anabas testudineus]
MNNFPTLICFFLISALQDGNTVSAKTILHTRTEGEDVTVNCSFSSSGTRKFFCKNECEKKDIVIETNGDGARSGRYSMEPDGEGFLMTIRQLTKSDSGQYWCGLDRPSTPTLYKRTEIFVADALLGVDRYSSEESSTKLQTKAGRYVSVVCYFARPGHWRFFCKEQCEGNDVLVETDGYRALSGRYSLRYVKGLDGGGFVHVTITQLTESDSGWYWCGLNTSTLGFALIVLNDEFTQSPPRSGSSTLLSAFPGITPQSGQRQTERTDTVVLYAGVSLVIVALLLPAVVLIFCRKRFCKPKGGKQVVINENDPPDSTYQSLDPATRNQAQFYSTLRHTHDLHHNL